MQIWMSRNQILGTYHIKNGICVDPEKIEAILSIQTPKNIKQLLSFIQTCSWYRRFIPDFASVIQPMSKLTRKNQNWQWDKEQQDAFN